MDDVYYLVEDNAMDGFLLSSEMDGTHGRPAQRRVQAGNKTQILAMTLVTWRNSTVESDSTI